MHQTSQRRLCRILFVALCLVPTLSLLAYAAWVRLPGYRSGWIAELQDATGLSIAIDDVQHPIPGTTRLVNFTARDPQTNELIAEIREINVDWASGVLRIGASQPQLQTPQLAALWRRLEERFLHGIAWKNNIELTAGQCTFHSPDGRSQTLNDFHAQLQRGDSRAIQASYRVAGVAMQQAAEVRWKQLPRDHAQATRITWQTGGAALPVAAWASRFPALAPLGPRAEFRGEATIELQETSWSATLSGELLHVDLDRLVSDQFPHKLSGDAKIVLDHAEVRDGRLVVASGRMEAGPGVIGRSLIDAASAHWQWKPASASQNADNARQRYAALHAQFELTGQTLQLAGICPGAITDAILIYDQQTAWQTPGENTYPSVSLIRVLAGASELNVPATSASRNLIGILPLPDRQKKEEPAQPPRGHLRP